MKIDATQLFRNAVTLEMHVKYLMILRTVHVLATYKKNVQQRGKSEPLADSRSEQGMGGRYFAPDAKDITEHAIIFEAEQEDILRRPL